jgi:hypothetical protein
VGRCLGRAGAVHPKQRRDRRLRRAVAQAFEGFIDAGGDDAETPALASWDFEQLFRILDANVEAVGLDRVTRIQWYFFLVLGFDPPTTMLHRRLADEPAFFSEIVSLVYRPRADVDAGVPPDPDRDPQVSQNAYHLLDSWSVPPGLGSDGQFDPARCEARITEATQLLAAADRLAVGRHHLGQVLTYAPEDDNGWPSEAVAAIIEHLDDDDIDDGFQLKIRNRRGDQPRSHGGRRPRA